MFAGCFCLGQSLVLLSVSGGVDGLHFSGSSTHDIPPPYIPHVALDVPPLLTLSCYLNDSCLRSGPQGQWFSSCDPWTSRVGVTWELVRSTTCLTYCIGTLGVKPSNVFNKPPRGCAAAHVWEPEAKPEMEGPVHVILGGMFLVREVGQGRSQ